MKVLVTGATGFIGYETARQLAEQGVRPRCMVRRPERALLLHTLDAELVFGDLGSRRSLRAAVDGVDAVIHLAARATFEEHRLVAPTIVGGSTALAEAAAEAGVERFVFGSSMLVYRSDPAPIDETTPAWPTTGYGRAKIEAERALTSIADRRDMGLVSLRLPHVYGARDLLFSRIARHPGTPLALPGRASNRFTHLHVADAARMLVAAARSDLAGAWPAADHQPTTWVEFFDVLRAHHPRVRIMRLPAPLATVGATALVPARRLRRRPSMATPDSVASWNLNLEVQGHALWDRLGLAPLHPTIHQGIPAALDECVSYRWLHPVDDHRQA